MMSANTPAAVTPCLLYTSTTVFTLFQQFLTEIRKVETFTAEHCFGSINDTYHMEFQSVFHHEDVYKRQDVHRCQRQQAFL